jgi:hypothetical protein
MKTGKAPEASDLASTKEMLKEKSSIICRNGSTGEVKEINDVKEASAFFKRGYNHCGGCGHRYYDMIVARPKSVGKCHWCLEDEE